jgi:hypothetical protein
MCERDRLFKSTLFLKLPRLTQPRLLRLFPCAPAGLILSLLMLFQFNLQTADAAASHFDNMAKYSVEDWGEGEGVLLASGNKPQLGKNSSEEYNKQFSAGIYFLGGLRFFDEGVIGDLLSQSGIPHNLGYGYSIGLGGTLHLRSNVISVEFGGGLSKASNLQLANDIELRKVIGAFNIWYQRVLTPFRGNQRFKLLPGIALGYVPVAGVNIDWVDDSGQSWGRRLLEAKGPQYLMGLQVDYLSVSRPQGHSPGIVSCFLRYSYVIAKFSDITTDTSDKEPYLDIFEGQNRELDFSGHLIEIGFGVRWF